MINAPRILRLMYWNANSIRNKIVEFYDFISTNDIHIACLSETHLKPEIHIHSHPDYVIYRLDRVTRDCGGVAIVVRRGLRHRLLPDLGMKLLETIGVEVILQNNSRIRVYSTYLPGSSRAAVIRQHFLRDLRLITSNNRSSYFLCGDFNAKHQHFNCRNTNAAGRLLYDEYTNSDFVVAFPDSHTYIPEDPNRNPSTIDLMITNSLLQYSDLSCHYLGSDHNAVCTNVRLSTPSVLNNERSIRAFDKTDWVKYQRDVLRNLNVDQAHIDDITSTDQIDHMIDSLTNAILTAQDANVPLIRPNGYRIELTPYLRFLIIMRRYYRRQWMRSYDPLMKTTVNALTGQIRSGIQELRNDNWSKRLNSLPQDDNKKSLWRLTKFLKNRNRSVPPLKSDDRTLITAEEKAEALANKFADFHENPLSNNDPQFTAEVEQTVTDFLSVDPDLNDLDFPNQEEIMANVKRLKTSKAPGMDKVHNTLIKRLPPQAISYLTLIICCCLKFSYFPSKWKSASVIPIRKPGKDASLCTSYRPISLLSSLSKILERVILNRMNKHTENDEVLPTAQHGFRSFYSTTSQLHRVTERLRSNLRRKRTTGVLLFDIEKAFDRIWHDGLIYKMIQLRYPKYIIHMICSFIKNRKFRVVLNSYSSCDKYIPAGTPQGAVLSPSLYNIYTSDVPTFPDCMTAFYADDSALLSAFDRWQNTQECLTTAAHAFYAYYEKWRINLNTAKTQALLVTNRRFLETPDSPFLLNDVEIEWEDEAKYLGFILDRKLTMKKHVEYVIEKTQNATRILYSLLHRKSKLNQKNKVLLFKTCLRPIYMYGCPLFSSIAKSHLNKLQRTQNKLLKMVYDLPWHTPTLTLHEENDIELVEEFASKLTERFRQRLIFIEN